MNPLVVIPARGGSKGVPRKNIKLLNGKPLIQYTIEAAKGVFSDEHICVSTDDEEIKSVEQQYCEWLKPSLNSLWGTKHTKDSIDKMRKSQREYWSKNSHPRKGVPFTEEHRKNLSKSMGKKCCVDGVIYESVKECAKILDIHRDTASWRMRSKSFPNYYYI